MANSTIDLSTLPPPRSIEELDYEVYVARATVEFKAVWAAVKLANPEIDLPDYNLELLETDPFMIINESESARETKLRARINEALRATLLAFATGADLDNLGAFYDVLRLVGERDDRFVARIILAIQGRSTGGTEPRYKYVAMTADTRVKDAIVYTVGRSPLIHVAIFSTDPGGVASPELVSIVDAALQDPAVKMVNDTIVVASAVQTTVNLEADIWLLPDASDAVRNAAAENLRAQWALHQSLGKDLTQSWWTSKLMIGGVHKVVPISPVGDVVAPPSEAIAIGTITLNNRGRAF
ncbi:Baseplate J family protein [Pseudorhizobium banfieldiae]|uniref:Baseplate J family protein n=1 Tax=Pseudorhizobium banfieldiae TaxID=1125847 RepID=L0NDP4_9HYPH|nr:baseplate J/gp47 family protein [Pseudorhizobium banfieldiae]CAD6606240.1 phage baseplate assembly protein GpJ [arsenite-oxidising bacterium NT-25]CCF19165.1 Baseplate J family protein [Pseudorhizobium banfieldiae]